MSRYNNNLRSAFLTNAEILKECRKVAKIQGLTLKRDKTMTINGMTVYFITQRRLGLLVAKNMTLHEAHAALLNRDLD